MSKYTRTLGLLAVLLMFLLAPLMMQGCALPRASVSPDPEPFEMKVWGEATGVMLPGCLPQALRQDIGPYINQAIPAFDYKAAFIEIHIQENPKRMCAIALYGTGACWKLMALTTYCFDTGTGKNAVARYWAYKPTGEFTEVSQEVHGELVKNIDLDYIYRFCPEGKT